MAILRRASAVMCVMACSVATAACDLIREPLAVTLTEDQAAVLSVLSAGDSTARVLLTIVPATSDPFNPFGEPNWIPIANAHVRLVAGVDTITLTAQTGAAANACLAGPVHDTSPAGALLPGCYVGVVPGGIRSGTAYTLIADLPGRGRAEGSTTVPAAPAVVQPSTGGAVEVWTSGPAPDPTVVEWSGVAAGSTMELRVSSHDEQCSVNITTGAVFGELPALRVTGSSSAEMLVRMDCSAPGTGAAGDIILTAYDTAYSRYSRTMFENHGRPEASAGLKGPVIGVLGSAAAVRHPVQFVRD